MKQFFGTEDENISVASLEYLRKKDCSIKVKRLYRKRNGEYNV